MRKIIISLSIIVLALSACTQKEENYNILWLSVEDISPLISEYGVNTAETPNISRLATEGIRFTNAYATEGVCAPSRSSIITAMHPASIGTEHMRTAMTHVTYRSPERESLFNKKTNDINGKKIPPYSAVLPAEVKCFSEYIRANDYYCTNSVKTDYQFACPITAWDESSPEAHWKNRPEGKPFFSVINFIDTHESQVWGRAKNPMLVNKDEVRVPEYYPDNEIVRTDVARVYSNIEELDQKIGQTLAELEADGLLDKTIIFFWSDHGGPLLRQKRAVNNSGLHVPLIVRFPDGNGAGTTCEDLVSLMDLGPTVMSLLGIKPPEYMQGRAFLGKYKEEEKRKYIFGGSGRFDAQNDFRRSVLNDRYVYIRNFYPEIPEVLNNKYRKQLASVREMYRLNALDSLEGAPARLFAPTKAEEEFYDLQSDPDEVNNQINNPEYESIISEMRDALKNWQNEIDDTGFLPEYELVNMMWPGMKQPVTEPVVIDERRGELTLSSPTPGASIGYQLNKKIGSNNWDLYYQPLKLTPGDTLVTRAIRIGYKHSQPVQYIQK
ncbi:sulfatase [Labilibacter sediminis]|nr:sulfatase [Labilibacter sediminis]